MKIQTTSNASIHNVVLQILLTSTLLISAVACSSSSDSGLVLPPNTNGSNSSGSNTSPGNSPSSPSPSPANSASPSPSPTPDPTKPPTTSEPTLIEKIKALEDSGAYPKLDRSADIKGPDVNNNGVRDDIDAWIAALPITDAQKKAATQDAQILQRTLLVDLADKVALQAVGDGMAASTKCLGDAFNPKREESYKLSSKIEAMTANTKERATRYMLYNRARSGSSTPSPKDNYCK